MSKNVIIGIVVAVAVVAAGGIYAIYSSQKTEVKDSNETTNQQEGKKMSFSNFVKQGGSHQCSITQNFNGTTSQGTLFINGEMIRGDVDTQVNGATYQTHLIVKDGYTYVWSSAMANMGIKAKVTTTGSDESTATSGQYSFSTDQVANYDCTPWIVDASLFTLPSGVTFTDTASMQIPR